MTRHPQEFRVLFLGKKDNLFAERAADFINRHFRHPLVFFGTRHDKLPEEVLNWKGDLIIHLSVPGSFRRHYYRTHLLPLLIFIPAVLNILEQDAPISRYTTGRKNMALPVTI
ncbi:MAG: hypothetical protein WDO16_01090 [Bacteroidota bacterium]